MTVFVQGFEGAFLPARIITVVLLGLVCGYAVARTHTITSTPIAPALVGILSTLWLVCLQIATWWVPNAGSSAVVYHSLGGHMAYVVLSVFMGGAGWAGAWWAQRGRSHGPARSTQTR